eukprot:TRINITY_DN26892_c0_g1_i6.p2 TRINITY_DN26892_c0_g1~~TRINITY_DN26892_c0_g1_i6.p2  ORF type:complete len:115 (-),score=30.04 TRINITY_DN26892_c0_g1_i6:407-751(-)
MKRRLAERKASDAVDELAKAVCNPKSTVDALIQAAKKDVAEAEMTTAVNRFAKAIGKSVSEVVGLIESVWTDVAQKGYEFSKAMKRRLAERKASDAVDEWKGERRSQRIGQGRV